MAGQAGVLRAGGRDLVELHRDPMPSDFGLVAALPSTGISQIDAQLQGLSVTMLGLLTQFSALSTAQ